MRITKSQLRISTYILFAIIIASIIQAYCYGTWRQDEISIWIFDVGQGDAIFIDTDIDVLIDGGPTSLIIEKLTKVIPFWDRTIDLVVSTHPHADHITGLIDVLRRYIVKMVWVSGQEYETSAFNIFENLSISITHLVSSGTEIQLQDNVSLKVLWPTAILENKTLDDPNDGSIVALVDCYNTKILLTADIGNDQECAIIDSVGNIDVLKVGHQGSNTSSSDEFLRAIDPEVAIISVGENDYGHPHKEVLGRLDSVGADVYRTDLNGDIRIICSQDGYEVRTY